MKRRHQKVVEVERKVELTFGSSLDSWYNDQCEVCVKENRILPKLRPKHLCEGANVPELLRDKVVSIHAKASELGIEIGAINQTIAEHLIKKRYEAAIVAARVQAA